MLDFNTPFGRYMDRRLGEESIIWLTTLDAHDRPQPRPVWFHWDGRTVLIFSEKNKPKLRHIGRNPKVALNFNTDKEGGNVAVLMGDAEVANEPPAPTRVQAYLKKYGKGIKDLGMTVAQFTDAYAVAILVTPETMRGFVE